MDAWLRLLELSEAMLQLAEQGAFDALPALDRMRLELIAALARAPTEVCDRATERRLLELQASLVEIVERQAQTHSRRAAAMSRLQAKLAAGV